MDWKLNRYSELNKHILLFVGLKILGTYGSVERIIKLNMIRVYVICYKNCIANELLLNNILSISLLDALVILVS